MNKFCCCFLLLASISFAQQMCTYSVYHYGQSGMELIAKSSKETVIVSTYNSKMNIRQEIARKVYDLYAQNKLESNKKYTIPGTQANVTGSCIIHKKGTLTSVDFYYEKVEWYTGLIEFYKNFIG